MARGPDAGRRKIDLARIGFDIGDELGNRSSRYRWIHFHHVRYTDDACDRGYVANEVEIELVIECRIDSIPRAHQEEGMAVCRCTHHRLSADIAAGTRPALDDEWWAKPLR